MRPPAPAPARRAPAGFTLVEVLVGALVLGIFLSFVYGAVIAAFQSRDLIHSTTSALSSGTLAVELVARDLENAFVVPAAEADLFKATEEAGERARVDFLTTVDSRGLEEIDRRLLRSDITEVGYRTRAGERGDTLYRREQFAVDDHPLEGGDYRKVVDGVRQFSIEWYESVPTEAPEDGADEKEPERGWDAKDKKKLPGAAKIILVLEGRSTDPSRSEELEEFRFTRWVVFPGAYDREPPQQQNPQNPGGGGGGGGGG